MSWVNRLKAGLLSFMRGRRGADELSFAAMVAGLVLSLLSNVFRWPLIYLLSLALMGYAVFRMLSRNLQKRYAENRKFVDGWHGLKTNVQQALNRLKNTRRYRYFKCPECHSRLRLPRKVGEVTVTCGKCHHAFKQKA